MFKCCYQSCNNFLQPDLENGGLYVGILNKTQIPISFIVQYSVDVRTFTKHSPVFQFNKSEKIYISHSAVNICFNVLNNSTNPPGFICNVVLPDRKQHCYKLVQTHNLLQLIQIKC
ncbi:hypothetical protein FDF89_04905 [Clostridium botulinum]|nr:hypothetical protein [Clostridium botulinum]